MRRPGVVKVFVGTPHEYYLDGYLLSALDTAKAVITKDWDMLFLVDGAEGGGKSVLAQQVAYYCDPTLTLDRIAFTPEEFKAAILKAQKYQAVIYDEAYTGLSSRAAMSLVNRSLVSMLAEIRQKNLFIVVVMPTFFDLDKYVALWRSRGLFHVYTGENFERGYFAFYNVDAKKDLFVYGKKTYSYAPSTQKPNFTGRFTSHYPIDEAAYKAKKLRSLSKREAQRTEEQHAAEVETELFHRIISLGDAIPEKTKMQLAGVSRATYYRRLHAIREAEADDSEEATE